MVYDGVPRIAGRIENLQISHAPPCFVSELPAVETWMRSQLVLIGRSLKSCLADCDWTPAAPLTCGRAERVFAQEIEVAAAVGLQDFAVVEKGVAALGNGRGGNRTARQLLRCDQQVEAALGD